MTLVLSSKNGIGRSLKSSIVARQEKLFRTKKSTKDEQGPLARVSLGNLSPSTERLKNDESAALKNILSSDSILEVSDDDSCSVTKSDDSFTLSEEKEVGKDSDSSANVSTKCMDHEQVVGRKHVESNDVPDVGVAIIGFENDDAAVLAMKRRDGWRSEPCVERGRSRSQPPPLRRPGPDHPLHAMKHKARRRLSCGSVKFSDVVNVVSIPRAGDYSRSTRAMLWGKYSSSRQL